jgi:hypothetical protein
MHGEDGIDLGIRELVEAAVSENPRIVDEDVHAAECIQGGLYTRAQCALTTLEI